MDCVVGGDAVFAGGGDESADVCPGFRAGLGAVCAGDLDLCFGRAEIAFGLVVGERDGDVVGEAQDLVVPVTQAGQQVAGLDCLRPGPRECRDRPTAMA